MHARVWLAALLMALVPTVVHGQEGDSDDILITAEVLDDLAVTGAVDLDFGVLGTNETSTIGPTEAGAGRFDVTGTAEQDVEVTSDDEGGIDLVNGDGATISFDDPEIAGSPDSEDAADADPALDFGGTATLGTDGGYHVFLGGTLVTGAESGTFSGDFTITVAYPEA